MSLTEALKLLARDIGIGRPGSDAKQAKRFLTVRLTSRGPIVLSPPLHLHLGKLINFSPSLRNISLKNIAWKMSKGWPPSDATEEARGLLAGKELLHQGNRE